MSAIRVEAFVAIEKSLVDRLSKTWEAIVDDVQDEIDELVAEGNWEGARSLAERLDLSEVFDENREYIRYSSYAALLFGASRLTEDIKESIIAKGGFGDVIDSMVDAFEQAITVSFTEQVVDGLLFDIEHLQLTANGSSGDIKLQKEAFDLISKENPFHDAEGRFASRASAVSTFWHGTTAEVVDVVLKEGLKPKGSAGNDDYLRIRGFGHEMAEMGERTASVYMTKDRPLAVEYSSNVSLSRGVDAAVFRVELPAAEVKKLKRDEWDGRAVRYEGVIKPEWITHFAQGEDVIYGDYHSTKKEEGGVDIFVMVPVVVQVQKANPFHDEKGKFTTREKDKHGEGPIAHDTVPKEVTSSVESIAKSLGGVSGKKEAADLVIELAKQHRVALEKMIDDVPDNMRPTVLVHRGDLEKGIPTVWALGWSDEEGTDIHDHAQSEVGVHILRGSIAEKVYGWDKKANPEAQTHPEGVSAFEHERDAREGTTLALGAPYIHEMKGFAKEGGKHQDISVHAYFPPLKKMAYYQFDKETGKLKYDGEWEEGKEPSAAERAKIRKANQFHDEKGRFTSRDKARSYDVMMDDMKKQQKEAEKTLPKGVRFDAQLDGDRLPLETLTHHMEMMAQFQRDSAKRHGLKYGGSEDFVLGEGQEWTVPDAPPPIKLGVPKECYKNSVDILYDHPDHSYVEGFVMSPKLPFPIQHAWLVDKEGVVLDNTLGWSPKARYFGVKFETRFLHQKLVENSYYGLFSDGNTMNKIVLGKDTDYVYK